jgi:hypothetical protein
MSTKSRTLQAVAAIEYQTGETNKVILVEGMYMHLFDDPGTRLLIWDRESAGVAALLRWPLFSVLQLELTALVGLRPLTQVIQPQLNVQLGDWVASVGGLWLNGEELSFGGYFQRNRTLYAKLKGVF